MKEVIPKEEGYAGCEERTHKFRVMTDVGSGAGVGLTWKVIYQDYVTKVKSHNETVLIADHQVRIMSQSSWMAYKKGNLSTLCAQC